MAYTYSKIATYTVGSGGVASIDFLNIPQTYTDLVIKISARTTRSVGSFDNLYLRFNQNSAAVYSDRAVYGDGSSALSYLDSNITGIVAVNLNQSTQTANTFASADIYIPNYSSERYKSISADSVAENNATLANGTLTAGIWANTSPITSISLSASTNFVQYSTAHLYGIKAEI